MYARVAVFCKIIWIAARIDAYRCMCSYQMHTFLLLAHAAARRSSSTSCICMPGYVSAAFVCGAPVTSEWFTLGLVRRFDDTRQL